MDGIQKHINSSIQLKLSFFLSFLIVIIAVIAGTFSYLSAYHEAHEQQDDTLRQIGALFDSKHLPLNHADDDGRIQHSNEESRVIVQSLRSNKRLAKNDSGAPLIFPITLADGLHTKTIAHETFRFLIKTMSNGDRIVVAQETDIRDEIAHNSALLTIMPFLILIPILLIIVSSLIKKIFFPIAELASEIEQRHELDLQPLSDEYLPSELRPFVLAMNELLKKIEQSVEVQQRFVADAAHELRSPLTAMSLQAERLKGSDMSDVAYQRLASLQQGIERGRNLLEQLLTLAKVQAVPCTHFSQVSIQKIYRLVLEDLMPLAEVKNIDIGVEGEQDCIISVNEIDMITLIRNLVDNAIRYTPHNGRVDLSVINVDNQVILTVKDNGPGIMLEERKRIFDPFYRTLGSEQVGSGLGMSIVKTITTQIGANIELDFSNKQNESGLLVRIMVPLNPKSTVC